VLSFRHGVTSYLLFLVKCISLCVMLKRWIPVDKNAYFDAHYTNVIYLSFFWHTGITVFVVVVV